MKINIATITGILEQGSLVIHSDGTYDQITRDQCEQLDKKREERNKRNKIIEDQINLLNEELTKDEWIEL